MGRVSLIIDAIARAMICITVSTAAIVVILQVFVRYFMGFSFSWGDEVARYLLVWTTFLGASVALKEGKMVRITLLVDKLPPFIARIVGITSDLVACIFLVIVMFYGSRLVLSPTIMNQVSPAMGLPMYLAYAIIPVGAFFMFINTLSSISDKIFTHKEGSET